MEWRDEALILSARPFGENSKIVDLLALNEGRAAGMVRGARSKSMRALLQPALRAAGVDTRDADRKLMGAYSGYRELKDRLDQGFRIGNGVIAHLAGSHEYPT